MAQSRQQASSGEYQIRPFRPEDRGAFLDLYEAVWGAAKDRSWFDWRFDENPRADDVAMVVAEMDGRFVGAEPLLPFELRAGDRSIEAVQPVDWMVHPDYRREGVFSRMTETLLERFRDDASVLFNFPNRQLLPGLERFDWRTVDAVPSRYRVQDPRAVTDGDAGSPTVAAATIGRPLVRGTLGVLDRVGSTAPDVSVDRYDSVPGETVAACYAADRPERVHVPRTPAYVRWRFANPRWDVTAYVARRDGEPVATTVVATEHAIDGDITHLLDVQPMTTPPDRADAFEAILQAVLADATDAALLTAASDWYPDVQRRTGFLRDDHFPFSRVSTATYHAVRPLGAGLQPTPGTTTGAAMATTGTATATPAPADVSRDPLVVDGYDLTDPEDWLLAPADRDPG